MNECKEIVTKVGGLNVVGKVDENGDMTIDGVFWISNKVDAAKEYGIEFADLRDSTKLYKANKKKGERVANVLYTQHPDLAIEILFPDDPYPHLIEMLANEAS